MKLLAVAVWATGTVAAARLGALDWRSIGQDTALIGATVAAVGFLARTRPIRWVWGRLVAEPVTDWAARVSTAANAPLSARIVELEVKVDAHTALLESHDAKDTAAAVCEALVEIGVIRDGDTPSPRRADDPSDESWERMGGP